jgi:hypothetical protein
MDVSYFQKWLFNGLIDLMFICIGAEFIMLMAGSAFEAWCRFRLRIKQAPSKALDALNKEE